MGTNQRWVIKFLDKEATINAWEAEGLICNKRQARWGLEKHWEADLKIAFSKDGDLEIRERIGNEHSFDIDWFEDYQICFLSTSMRAWPLSIHIEVDDEVAEWHKKCAKSLYIFLKPVCSLIHVGADTGIDIDEGNDYYTNDLGSISHLVS